MVFVFGLVAGGVVSLLIWLIATKAFQSRPDLRESLALAATFDLSAVTARHAEKHHMEPARLALVEQDFRRFFAIAAASPRPVGIRSEPVDDYWHELILHTRLYGRFCDAVAGRFFHHDPTGGSEARYARTWTAWVEAFGEEPDPSLWPAPDAETLAFFRSRAEEERQRQELDNLADTALHGRTGRAGPGAPASRDPEPRLLGASFAGIFAAAAVLAVLHPAEQQAGSDGGGGGGGCSGGDGDGSAGGGCGGGGDGGGCGGGGGD